MVKRVNPDLPVKCLPKIPHKLKMAAKKAQRKLNSTADGWRLLVDKLYEEIFDDEGNIREEAKQDR